MPDPGKIDRHDVSLLSDFKTGMWYADCSCGWEGPAHDVIRDAAKDARTHLKEADS